jgi:putative phosphoribosyl transferase
VIDTARFRDRRDAGRRLAAELASRQFRDPIVLALPRGGVPVGWEVATGLHAPLDVLVSRKVGAPGHPEVGVGAVVEGTRELVLCDPGAALGLDDAQLHRLASSERREVERWVEHYREGQPLPNVAGRSVLLVDDGLATGVTAEAAVRALSARRPFEVVLALPVCAEPAMRRLRQWAEVVCLECPPESRAVRLWYDDFRQVDDREILDLLGHRGTDAVP